MRRTAMGMLVDGVWHDEDPPTAGGDGSFVRPESGFRDRVTRDGSSGFKAGFGRYYDFGGFIVDDRAFPAVPQYRDRGAAGETGAGGAIDLMDMENAIDRPK